MGLVRGKPTAPPPQGNVTGPHAGPAGLIRPHPAPAKKLRKAAPKTIARSPAHTGARGPAPSSPRASGTANLGPGPKVGGSTNVGTGKPKAHARSAPAVRPTVSAGPVAPPKPPRGAPAKATSGAQLAAALAPVTALAHPTKAQKLQYANRLLTQHLAHPHLMYAPAVKVLSLAGRPSHGLLGATDALIRGKGLSGAHHAATRGLEGKDHIGGGEVLKDLGVHNKTAQQIGGLALDIGTDPVTYVTLGTGTIARESVEAAARKATEEAVAEGATRSAANRAGRAAAQKVLRSKRHNVQGVQVGMRFHVPFTDIAKHPKTSGRLTSKVAHVTGLSKGSRAVRNSKVVQGVGRTFGHDFQPKEYGAVQHHALRVARRKYRAEVATAKTSAGRLQKKLDASLPSDALKEREIIDMIESGAPLKTLGEHAPVARVVRRGLGGAHDVKRAANLLEHPFRPTGPEDAQRFLPHTRRQDVEPAAKTGGAGRVKVKAEHGRTIRKPLAVIREESPALFDENLRVTVPRHVQQASEKAALSRFWQTVAKTGRPFRKGAHMDLNEEAVYKVTPHGLESLMKGDGSLDHEAMAAELAHPTGKHVILNKRVVADEVKKLTDRPGNDEPVTRAYDKLTAKLKWLYTVPNPRYHVRNFTGDNFNAFLGDTSAQSSKQSFSMLKSLAARHGAEEAAVGIATPTRLQKTIKIRGHAVTHADVLQLAEHEGVLPSGFYAGELTDLSGKRAGKLQTASQYREWQPRLATFVSALKRGMTPSQASDWVAQHHFDYQDLTHFERTVARRVIPFYTFYARNTRLQATKLLTRPGKYATLSKVLNTAAQVAGFQSYDQYAGQLKDYKQRGLPFPLKVGGHVYDVGLGLPATDLNQVTTNVKTLAQDIGNRATFYKVFPEVIWNYSTFFQGQIQNPKAPRTPVPTWIGDAINALPGPLKDAAVKITGLQKIDDKHGGLTWGWYSKMDYAMRSLPDGGLILGSTLGGKGSRGQTPGQQLLGWASGASVVEHTNSSSRYSDLGAKLVQLQNHLGVLAQAKKKYTPDGYATPEYQRTLDQIKQVKKQRDGLRKQLGIVKHKPLKQRPLTVDQEIQRRLDNALKKVSPEGIDKEINRRLDRAGAP